MKEEEKEKIINEIIKEQDKSSLIGKRFLKQFSTKELQEMLNGLKRECVPK